jgi:hypothetical protein
MNKRLPLVLLLSAAILAGTTGSAVADTTGPIDGFDPVNQTFADVKSPPLRDSEVFATEWGMHVTLGFTNYAGILFDLKYDGHELSALTLVPKGPHVKLEPPPPAAGPGGGLAENLTFEGSQSSPQTVGPIAAWIDPAVAQETGMTVETSTVVPLFLIEGQAKNTATRYNSDVDIHVSPWQILHIVEGANYNVHSSDWIYVTENGDFANTPGAGRWVHNTGGGTTMFIPASAFVATAAAFTAAAGYGIEHVPEPAAIALLLAGLGLVYLGRRCRRGR